MLKQTLVVGLFFTLTAFAEPAGQATGSYAGGKLVNASALPMQGIGFIHLFQTRLRHYGTEGLVGAIMAVAEEMAIAFPGTERLQVGDLAAEKGGFISGHSSHQNGLDVDLVYFRKDLREQDLKNEKGFEESFVAPNGVVTNNFDTPRNWALIKAFYETGRLNRIFVDAKIKNEFCNWTKKTGEYPKAIEQLRSLRPWPAHDNHLHVRFTCPNESKECVVQAPAPVGSGCESSSLEFSPLNEMH